MNIIEIFRKPNLSLFASVLLLFSSCSQYDNDEIYSPNYSELNRNEGMSSKSIEDLKLKALNKITPLVDEAQLVLSFFETSVNSSHELENLTVNEALQITMPLVNKTNLALNELGFDPNLMKDLFGSNDDPRIALVGIGLVGGLNGFKADASGMGGPNILGCLGSAVGLDLLVAVGDALASAAVGGSASTITAETILSLGIKGLKRVLRNFIGPVGVLIAAYDFSSCMDLI
ncbi:hypothetical protein SAMN04487989_101441 [Bizionia echini]|uniref:Uncharacterized protein n=1 Tax=Bizionia echini TaxID=649333 RepID=A0A1I4Z1J1_9FLAO|nr:hypothetical protein [Bizionia echini]SFN44088.1 hypothetical protein SAMN04487989_101441 [Bizionia echini]